MAGVGASVGDAEGPGETGVGDGGNVADGVGVGVAGGGESPPQAATSSVADRKAVANATTPGAPRRLRLDSTVFDARWQAAGGSKRGPPAG